MKNQVIRITPEYIHTPLKSCMKSAFKSNRRCLEHLSFKKARERQVYQSDRLSRLY